ncbi:MAG: M23 family metallopeptidase [Bacteroidetes bacterium]|nr:MAG: M23 family metallopeptidase [Bacteroidota bacterium]
MTKIRYQFNTKSLAVEPVRETFWDKAKRFLRIVLAGMVFSVIVLSIGYTFMESPKERMLLREISQFKDVFQEVNGQLDLFASVLQDIEHRDDQIYRVIFEAEPLSRAVREAGYGGVDRYEQFEGFDNSELIASTMRRMDQLARQLVVQSKSYDEVFEMAKDKTDMLASIPAIVPIEKGTQRLVSGFGMRIHPIYKTLRMHSGVDFTAPTGTPIYAPGNGVVTTVERNRHGYGLMIVIDHGYGYETLYAHMSKFEVKRGQHVKRGEIIGYVGNTGVSTAPHLHYEVIRHGKKVNPVNYFFNDLSPEEFEYIIEVASRVNQSLS